MFVTILQMLASIVYQYKLLLLLKIVNIYRDDDGGDGNDDEHGDDFT